MASVSPVAAGVAGLKLLRDKPIVFVVWALINAAVKAGVIALSLITLGVVSTTLLPPFIESVKADAIDYSALLAIVAGFSGVVIVALPAYLALDSIFTTAVKRMVLHPEQSRYFYLRAGVEEFLVFLVRLVRFFVLFFLEVILFMAVLVLLRTNPILGFIACVPAIALVAYISTRLSLAAAQTYADRDFHLIGSWWLTKGPFTTHFLPIFLSYVVAFLFYLVVLIAAYVLQSVFADGAFAAVLQQKPDDLASMLPLLGFGVLVGGAVQIIQDTLRLPILGASTAAVYRDLMAAKKNG